MNQMQVQRILLGVCRECGSEVFGLKATEDDNIVVEPCEMCLSQEFDRGYREGYEDCSDLHYRKRLDLWLRRT